MVKEHYKGRIHKEREQPLARRRLGFLEKHTDYVIRAKHYHKNEEEYRKLQKAASQKHPDEFRFGMISTEVDDKGFHVVREPTLKGPQLKINNNLNHGYLEMNRAVDRKKIEKLESGLANLSEAGTLNKKTIFADSADEAIDLLKRRRQLQQKPIRTISSLTTAERQRLDEIRDAQYKELEQRKKRVETLKGLTTFLEEEKSLLSKGKRTAIKRKDGTTYYKWDPVRKR